jgi:hypothetical protein
VERNIILARSIPIEVRVVRQNNGNGSHFPSLFNLINREHEDFQNRGNNRNDNNRNNSHMNILNLFRPSHSFGITFVNGNNFLRNIEEGHIISEFPQIKIEDLNKLEESNRTCAICQLEFKVGEEVISLPCIHFFHNSCIKKSLETKKICPVCKFELTHENIIKKYKENIL